MKRLRFIAGLLITAAVISGCKKVADEKQSPLDPGQIVFYSVPAVKILSVEFSTDPSTPVDMYIVAGDAAEKAKTDMQNGKPPASPLATQKGASGTITASNPTKTEMTVLVTSTKKTTVKVKINGS
jgi:hypothetical protein